MDIQTQLAQNWPAFILCLARVSGFAGSMPVLSGAQVPVRFRAGLALMLTLVLFPRVREMIPAADFAPVHMAVWGAEEVLFGAMLGFMARLLFVAAEFGGMIVGYQMGFAAANIIDPQSQQQLQVLAQFQNVLAMLVFLAVDGHHVFIRAMARSFAVLPPTGGIHLQNAVPSLVDLTGEMFVLGLQLGAPIFVILLLSDFILGIMSRIFPQLNAFMLKFPINIGISFIFFGIIAEFFVNALVHEFTGLGPRISNFFHLMSP